MGKRWIAGVGVLGAALVVGGSAAGAGDPLLVVVEAQPGSGVDAREVRRRIATELGQPVASPRDLTATAASNVLIVAIDNGGIRVSLREGALTRVSRVIPDAAEGSARLRAIAWLAGNLARDQVSPILPRLAASNFDAPATGVASPGAPHTRERAATEPPAQPALAPPALPPATVAAQAQTARAALDARWAMTVSGGVTETNDFCFVRDCGRGSSSIVGSHYQVEVQHQTAPAGVVIGAALDAGPDSHLLGVAGLVGSHRQWRSWFLEATVGIGVEAVRVWVPIQTVLSSSSSGIEASVTTQVEPGLYARAIGTIGRPVSDDFDLVARLGVHVAMNGFQAGSEIGFASATVGVRLRLP
jgi:hypothetical protein